MTRLLLCLSALLLSVSITATASDTIALDPRSPVPAAGEHLQVEQIEVGDNAASPSSLRRKAGRFVLVITNRSRLNADAAFVIDPSSVGDGVVGPSPLLRMGGTHNSDYRRRSASLFDASVGSYDLKFAGSGKILCHIQIDSVTQ